MDGAHWSTDCDNRADLLAHTVLFLRVRTLCLLPTSPSLASLHTMYLRRRWRQHYYFFPPYSAVAYRLPPRLKLLRFEISQVELSCLRLHHSTLCHQFLHNDKISLLIFKMKEIFNAATATTTQLAATTTTNPPSLCARSTDDSNQSQITIVMLVSYLTEFREGFDSITLL